MPTGLYPNMEFIERFQASVSAANIAQPFVAPTDLDVIGMMLHLGTAVGGTSTMTVNISNSPTSQINIAGSTVAAYNLWTATNVPSITGTAVNSFSTTSTSVVQNAPYALNYPLPGPSGTVGYRTAQATSQTTETPVTAPPSIYIFELAASALVAPDNVYTDVNGNTSAPGSVVHAGDVLTFVVGGTVGSAANLEMVLFATKR